MPEIACHGIPTNYFTKPYTKNSAAQILPNKDSRKLNVYLVRLLRTQPTNYKELLWTTSWAQYFSLLQSGGLTIDYREDFMWPHYMLLYTILTTNII